MTKVEVVRFLMELQRTEGGGMHIVPLPSDDEDLSLADRYPPSALDDHEKVPVLRHSSTDTTMRLYVGTSSERPFHVDVEFHSRAGTVAALLGMDPESHGLLITSDKRMMLVRSPMLAESKTLDGLCDDWGNPTPHEDFCVVRFYWGEDNDLEICDIAGGYDAEV